MFWFFQKTSYNKIERKKYESYSSCDVRQLFLFKKVYYTFIVFKKEEHSMLLLANMQHLQQNANELREFANCFNTIGNEYGKKTIWVS